jgi:ribonucleoside-diphosphate reductase alpha chain
MQLIAPPTTVTNRSGQRVPIDIGKIRAVISQACQGLSVDPLALELDARLHFSEGMATTSIQDVLVRVANEKVTEDTPDWTYVAARLLLHDWYEETQRVHRVPAYHDYPGLVHRMVQDGRYDARLVTEYSSGDLSQMGQTIHPERDLLFNYPGLKHLRDRYALHTAGNEETELPQHIFMGIAAFLGLAEEPRQRLEWVFKFYSVLSQLQITMATPTFAHARSPEGQLSSCFVDTLDDSIPGIFDSLHTFAEVSQNGGGMGVYLGHLRGMGSTIRSYRGVGSGIIPWVRLFNDTAVSVNQLGQRAGAVSLWLDIWHKDIVDFLDVKTNNGDERRKARDIFPGVTIPDYFYHCVEHDALWYLFDPHEVEATMGFNLEDSWGAEWERRYQACINQSDLSRTTLPALELMALLLRSLYETGSPFVFHRDTVNRANPNKHAGMIYSSNLCTEICQNQSSTRRTVHDFEGDTIRTEHSAGDLVVCNLSSINLGRTNTPDLLSWVIPIQVRMLDNVITLNHLPVPSAVRTNLRYRAIGIGISGYHQHLVQKGLAWESEEHLRYSDELFELINFTAIRASSDLAAERGSYPLFSGSDWDNGEYFTLRGYTSARWQSLHQRIRTQGMRHGYLMAIAPTGSTSVIAGSTAGIDPVFKAVYTEEKKGFVIRQVAPGLTHANRDLYQDAHHVDQQWSIRAAAVRQRHLDQSQSFNLYASAGLDESTFLNLYYQAWKQGLKSVYYFRNSTEETGDSVALPAYDSCESCQA